MERSTKAIEFFKNNYNCSQSVCTAFSQDFNLTDDQALKLSCAFGGGIARQQQICGAVSGALMVLGLKYGRGVNDDVSKKTESYKKAHEFMNEFKKKHNTVNCKELLRGLDMNNEEDAKKIGELRLYETDCVAYVKDAVGIVEKMI
jgi:C_GCAxxG_C_C family probable redox protein